MQQAPEQRRVLRFGAFELDLIGQELRKSGLRIKLQDQPFHILALLLEHPGSVVSREEIRQKLWPNGTFVDFEHSLNTAVKKLREALGDDADNPRFVETLHRRGYKFVAPVDGIASSLPVEKERVWSPTSKAAILALVAVSLAAAIWGIYAYSRPPLPTIGRAQQLTHVGAVRFPNRLHMHFPALATDGTRVYFTQVVRPFALRLAQALVPKGDVSYIATPFQFQLLHHISADGSRLLVEELPDDVESKGGPLWAVPVSGNGPLRLGGITGHAGAWSPDDSKLAFAYAEELYLAGPDGSNPHKLATTPGRAYWIRWSPDGRHLRFTLVDRNFHTSLWEVSASGTGLRQLLTDWNGKAQPCCGEWAPDGKNFVFSAYENGRSDIWLRPESKGRLSRRDLQPVRLTSGPLDFPSAIFSRDGRKLHAVNREARTQLLKFDLKTRQIRPFFPALNRTTFYMVRFSPDKQWLAYTEGTPQTLWRSRVDGSERLQLTTGPMESVFPRWSPDGKQIAFIGRTVGTPHKLYIVPSSGGAVRQLRTDDRQEIDPDWSPDGASIMFGRPPDLLGEAGLPKAIHIMNLKTGETTTLPGSEGLFSPRWSPDGRYVAAMPLKKRNRLMRFDFRTEKWSELVPFSASDLALSPDGDWVYFESLHQGHNVSRVRFRDGHIERLLDFKEIERVTLVGCEFGYGVDLDNSPLLSCVVPNSDLHALELNLP